MQRSETPESSERGTVAGLLRRFAEESARLFFFVWESNVIYTRDLAALAVIAEAAQAGRPLGPARLAEALHLSPSATTTLIDRLETAGHLVRQPDPRDRRRTALEMQPQALEVASAFFEPLSVALDEVMDHYRAEQLTVIAAFLDEAVQATVNVACVLASEVHPTSHHPTARSAGGAPGDITA